MCRSLLIFLPRGYVRAALVFSFAFICAVISSPLPVLASVQVTDIRGRTVTIEAPARRILIDDGRFLVALSLIHPDPVGVIAAWPKDVNRIGPAVFAQYRAKWPAIESLPVIPSSAGAFALEPVLGAAPDVAVFSLGRGPSDADVAVLEKAGIPVVFIDFFTTPFRNLEPSLAILGKLTGREARAEAFIAFRRAHMAVITEALARDKADKPGVLLEVHAGMSGECCSSVGKGNIGEYVSFVGGRNIGEGVIPGAVGKLNLEYVITADPQVYIATGGPHLETAGGLVIGPGFTDARIRAALAAMAARPGIGLVEAVKTGRVHGLSHQLLNSPLDILAVEALARWIRPDLFGGIDPDRTLAEINARFLAVPLEGRHWIDMSE